MRRLDRHRCQSDHASGSHPDHCHGLHTVRSFAVLLYAYPNHGSKSLVYRHAGLSPTAEKFWITFGGSSLHHVSRSPCLWSDRVWIVVAGYILSDHSHYGMPNRTMVVSLWFMVMRVYRQWQRNSSI